MLSEHHPQGRSNSDSEYASESNFGRMMGVNGTLHVLAIIFVALRVYARTNVVHSFGYDDALMVASLLFVFGGGMVTQIYAGTHGALGRHADTVTREQMEVYGMMSFVQGVLLTVTSICLLKLSIAMSLLRLNSTLWYRRMLWFLIAFVCCYMVEGWISLLAFCTPVKAHWDKEAFKTARCWSWNVVETFAAVNTAFNITTDVAFAVIPIPMLWTLQTKLRVRLYLIGIFSLGFIVVAIGIVKLVFQLTTRGEPDKTFNNWIQFFGLMQPNVGIIVACAPILKSLMARRLKLDSSYIYGPSTSGRIAGLSSRSRQRPIPRGFTRESDDNLAYEMSRYGEGRQSGHQIAALGGGGASEDGGSESSILQQRSGQSLGVTKQTDITVITTRKTE